MSYDPMAVANHFLDLAARDRRKLTQMKLQKLVFYAHGYHLALRGVPLIDEPIQAWTYGPVVRGLYDAFKVWGTQPIAAKAVDSRFAETEAGGCPDPFTHEFFEPAIDQEDKESAFARLLIEKVWETYGGMTAAQLSTLTHEPDSPWEQVTRSYPDGWPRNTIISDKLIKAHFQGLLAPSDETR